MTYAKIVAPQESPDAIELEDKDGYLPPLLFNLLSRATPHGTERSIINLLPFKEKGEVDKVGNFIIKIGEDVTTMFSCHMDTVHTLRKDLVKSGVCGRIRLLTVKYPDSPQKEGYIYGGIRIPNEDPELPPTYLPCVLGADDKIGVYTMCKMIENEIPGLYVFHVGEEVGGIGSRWISAHNQKLVEGIKRCVAFDRRGYSDIITKQSPGRCASKAFSDELATRLNEKINPKEKRYTFEGDQQGTFTDSAMYRNIIPECVNISVGYFNQHGDNESFDWIWYNTFFLPAVLALDWDIPVTRDPKVAEVTTHHSYHYGGSGTGYHANLPIIATKDVTKNTPWMQIPKWDPKEGYLLECSEEGFLRIIAKWRGDHHEEATKLIADQLLHIMELEDENDFLQDQIDKANKTVEKMRKKDVSKIAGTEFVQKLARKRELVSELFSIAAKVKFHDITYRETFVPVRRKWNRMEEALRKKNPCTTEMYYAYNDVMLQMIGIIPDNTALAGLAELKRNCLIFVISNCAEQHFEQFKQKEDKKLPMLS